LYSMYIMARIVSRACVPGVKLWVGGGRRLGSSHVDQITAASSRVRPGVRRAIAASWKEPSMRRARGAEM
jgi:hypothetical protein